MVIERRTRAAMRREFLRRHRVTGRVLSSALDRHFGDVIGRWSPHVMGRSAVIRLSGMCGLSGRSSARSDRIADSVNIERAAHAVRPCWVHLGFSVRVVGEGENVRAGVVADGVEGAASGGDPIQIERSCHGPFLGDERAFEDLAAGSDDGRVAAGQEAVGVVIDFGCTGKIGRHVAVTDTGSDADHEDTSLLGDVPQRGYPLVAVVPGRRQQARRCPSRRGRRGRAACSSPNR